MGEGLGRRRQRTGKGVPELLSAEEKPITLSLKGRGVTAMHGSLPGARERLSRLLRPLCPASWTVLSPIRHRREPCLTHGTWDS